MLKLLSEAVWPLGTLIILCTYKKGDFAQYGWYRVSNTPYVADVYAGNHLSRNMDCLLVLYWHKTFLSVFKNISIYIFKYISDAIT